MITLILNGSSKDTLDVFSDFVPIEFEHYLGDESALLIGVVESGDNGLEACGITIVAFEDGEMIIKWISVDFELHNKGYGSKMLDICFKTALENNYPLINVEIPRTNLGDTDYYLESYFYPFGFSPVNSKVYDTYTADVLTADTDSYFNIDNDIKNEIYSRKKIEKEYDKFPNSFVVTGVEYFSGVPIVN